MKAKAWCMIPHSNAKATEITIEMRELVLCEDCKWWDNEETITDKRFCPNVGCCVPAKWFCADGERRCDNDT